MLRSDICFKTCHKANVKTKATDTTTLMSGHAVLAIWESKAGLALGLALVSLGAGAIKPCVSALVGDQFDKVRPHETAHSFACPQSFKP